MKIDFRAIPCKDIEGKVQRLDISKLLGNTIYQQTSDLGELDLAQRIYKEGEVELTSDEIGIVSGYVNKLFKAFVQQGFNELIR